MLQSEMINRPDNCLPPFARPIGGFPPAENPNIRPALPLLALHASLLIPCSPRHDLSWLGATDEINFIYAHSSGHAPLKDLQKPAAALKPKMLVPIHTEGAEGFEANSRM